LERETEVELARKLIAGEPEAFDRFVEHFRTKIFHYSWLMCGQREDAEEVAQETLLKVFENFEDLREPERVRPWVFRIAKNVCLMKRRKSVFAPSRELSLDDFIPAIDREGGHARLQIADWSKLPDNPDAGRGGAVHDRDRPDPRCEGRRRQNALASRTFGCSPNVG